MNNLINSYSFLISEEKPANQECEGCEADLLGEGGETGEINPSQSLVFTALQVKYLNTFTFLSILYQKRNEK